MTRALIEQRVAPTPQPTGDALQRTALAVLSERERDVLDAVARGLSNVEIARELYVSTATVKSHISSLLAKTGCGTRVQAAVFAFQSGFTRASAD
jgi:DNA-binding NarL/FixJ family response regulator